MAAPAVPVRAGFGASGAELKRRGTNADLKHPVVSEAVQHALTPAPTILEPSSLGLIPVETV